MKQTNIEDLYPLSPMQQGMLFHSLYSPSNGMYFEQLICDLHGELNIAAFEQAWQKLATRHPILRTAFFWEDLNEPLQVVHRQVHIPLEQHDWRSLSIKQQEESLTAFIQAQRLQGFKLSTAPLMRLAVLRMAEDRYAFIWNFHHILLDAWSVSLLLNEVFALYEALCENVDAHLEHSPPYRNYITWLQRQDLPQAEKFWRETLKGFTDPLALKIKPILGKTSDPLNEYNEQQKQLSVTTTEALKSFARGHQLTLNTLIQAAWALLLSRYHGGKEDIVFGTTVSGRSTELSGMESMIGLFINTLPVREKILPQTPLLSWLREFQARQIQLRQYEYCPLLKIQEWSEVPRGTSLFDTIVVFENYPVDASWQRNKDLHVHDVRTIGWTNYSLTMMVIPHPVLSLRLTYNVQHFDAATIARMLEHFQILLEGMLANSHQLLSDLPLLTQAEQQQLLVWNQTQTDDPYDQTVVDLFQAQVKKTPEAVAVVFEGQQLSYQQLNTQANQLAHYLISLGVQAETLVGICVERSLEMIIGLLGILKAGGAYVPLDPDYPAERLQFMLADAAVPVLLSQSHLKERLSTVQPSVVHLDTDWEQITTYSGENPLRQSGPKNLVYVIYTSGSTGKPKGVMIEHGSLFNHMQWMQRTFAFSAQDKVFQKTPFSFDASVWEFYAPLLVAGTLVIAKPGGHQEPEYLVQTIQDHHITILQLVPSLLRILLTQTEFQTQIPLRYLFCGGEPLTPELRQTVNTHYPQTQLYNLYGPTEATIDTTCWFCDKNTLPVAIGQPIANTQVYILDQNHNPVPLGIPGELCISGAGLARGYLNRPELTAEKFIPNPFSDDPRARLYKTGDLARYLPDGNIEYLGRIDTQVKLRGFRIELGEIETILTQHDAVKEAVVIVREDSPGDKRLVGYVVLHSGVRETANLLRQFLKDKLPEYMVPSTIVFLETLPLTPNGKIDRRALPKPEYIETEASFVAPRNDIELQLQRIWEEILQVHPIGVTQNFFELGGHSLLAIRLLSHLSKTFGKAPSVMALFQSPTIEQLVRRLHEEHFPKPLHIPIRPPQDPIPLSFAQQRLWFIEQLEPHSVLYHIPHAFELKGALDIDALQQALNHIVTRHEVLRTQFPEIEGQPWQLITPNTSVELTLLEANVHDLQTSLLEQVERPFNFSQDILFRATLIHLAPNHHIFLLVLHHIASDGWSTGILLRELLKLYQAFLFNHPSSLPPLPIQYADFAHWQRQWFIGELIESQIDYWKNQLAGIPTLLELPLDHLRPPLQTFVGKFQNFHLPRDLTHKLHQQAQQAEATLFMTLLAAFATLLGKYTRQEDIVVGSPVANRTHADLESLIGFFVNTLVLRTDLSGNPTFRELLTRVKQMCLEAYMHQELPFEKLVEVLQPERHLGFSPLFQVMLVLQNAPQEKFELPDLAVTPFPLEIRSAKFDLTLYLTETSEGLTGIAEYNTALFEDATVNRWIGHFQTLLENIVAHPDHKLSQLEILTQAEQQQLFAWNQTQSDDPYDQTVVDLFQAQVEKTPEAVAVVFEGQQLSYQQLNTQANQLAHYLMSLGVQAETLVGICVERSLEMIIGLLGILKAGGTYVPLDPNYPQERLNFILTDARITLLVTQSNLRPRFPTYSVICLDQEREILHRQREDSPDHQRQELAYVLYTSGSTGQPKGVQIPHRALTNFLMAMQKEPGLNSQEVLLAVTTISFDISGLELYLPLITGAKILLVSQHIASDGYLLSTYLSEATVMQATPTTWQVLLDSGWQGNPHLKILVGGEALSEPLARELRTRSKEVWNMYGPTETTIWSSVSRLSQEAVNLGRPIANTTFYMLDAFLKLVPIGIPGELYIGGAGLARGYLNRPELTAEKFIPNPFSDDPTARLYKTGDLARYLPDGNIEYLGRIDTQVKLRGFRIELGEIEAILTQHEAVKEAVVIVREDSPGDKRLIGYVILRSGRSETASQLRQLLKDKLPEYMVPATIVFLETLPLTPNGKIDRRALPKPDYLEVEASFVAPRNEIELQLQRIWEEILQIRLMSVTQNFFEAGGHSLLAIQLISRIRSTLNVELPLRTLFEHPTIADLATHLKTLQHLHLPPIQLIDRKENIPLSFAQQRLWFLDQLEGPSSTYNLPLALRLHGPLNLTALQKSLVEIIQRHESLRTTFLNLQGTPYQVIHPLTALWAKQQVLSVTEQPQLDPESLLQQEVQRPFDLEKGPLFRATLYVLGHEENLFLIVMHHIISDGWSMKNFIEELTRLYETFTQELPPHLPPLPLQYADFAHWQRQWLTEAILNLQLQYWKQKLADFPRLKLPTDRPRPTVQNYQGEKQVLTLPKPLTEALKNLSHQEHATLFMTLLTGFKLLLGRYAGQEDILLGIPLATRNRGELEGMIGIFLNNLVLRTDLSGHPSFRTLLSRVRQGFLEAHAHQDLPFEKLVEELQPERDLSKHPIFEVMFNFINIPPTELKLLGLQINELELVESNSKFLMTLYVKEQDHQLVLTLVYQREVFSTAYITTFLNQYQYLLEQIVATPDASIRSYSLVTLESQSYLPNPRADLVESTHEPITTLFNQWAQSIPMHPAICQPGRQTWTYGELAERAEALAQLFLAHPIKQGEVVAVFGSRSFGVIASMIGIFLAGGVLLTLEKSIPKFRQQLMLKEAQAKLLLYFDEMSPEEAWLKESLATLYVNPNTGQALHAIVQVRFSWPKLLPDDAAYIFFTSGSTGIPKGILGCHKGLAHFLTWQRQTFSVGPSDHCAQLTRLSFDVVLRDIFLPLTSGATLYLPPEGDELEPTRIFAWLEQEEISLLHIVPSLVQSWLTRVPPRISLRHLRRIFFAGEPLQESLVRQWHETFPEAGEVINLYGPTETTLAKCYFRVPKPPLFGIQPVGFPLPETQALVLSEEGRLCGVGESGEIVLRTPFRSLGYINALPEQQRRFVKNPFSDDERDILYYTGDRGRYRSEGLLEILGRFDHQVKVRGVRIELEEIETWLSQHMAVQSGVVHVWNEGEEARLVAYVVLKPGRDFSVEALKSFLKQHLPESMLPSAFMVLEALPLTSTGKVNRLALPQPEVFIEHAETFVAPRNDIELQLQRIWEEVLQVRPIGVTQNFFEVGGHSLLAIRLLNQIEKNFGQGSLLLIALFQSPTIAQQAKILSQGSHLVQWRTLEIIQPQGSLPPLFFFSPTEYILSLTTSLGTDQPIYKLNPLGLMGLYKEISSLDQVTQQYIQEIKMTQPEGPYYLIGFCGQAKVVLETARQLQHQGHEVAFLGLIQAIPYYPPWSLFHHWLKLRKMGFNYIKQRVQNKLRFLTKPPLSGRPREVAWANAKFYNKAPDQQSLNELEYKQFVDSFFNTLNRYIPSPSYPGQITLFYQSERCSKLFVEIELARSVAVGKIEIYEIPAKWNDSLFISPQAETLGRQLKQALEKTRMRSIY